MLLPDSKTENGATAGVEINIKKMSLLYLSHWFPLNYTGCPSEFHQMKTISNRSSTEEMSEFIEHPIMLELKHADDWYWNTCI